jgi:hypothetical protein
VEKTKSPQKHRDPLWVICTEDPSHQPSAIGIQQDNALELVWLPADG